MYAILTVNPKWPDQNGASQMSSPKLTPEDGLIRARPGTVELNERTG